MGRAGGRRPRFHSVLARFGVGPVPVRTVSVVQSVPVHWFRFHSSGSRSGFGSFVIKKRAQKVGRHIKENKAIVIPEHFIPAFKPAKVFVEQVKENVTSSPNEEKID